VQVVEDLSANSVIDIGDDGKVWSEDASSYADKISRSRFCFCPRGDSMSSRRIFDAVSAGCIPVLTVKETRALPFLRAGLNYSEFAVVEDMDGFSTTQSVEAIVTELSSRSDAQLTTLREGLARSKSSILYGVSTGPELSDMEPFADTASMFLREVRATLGTGGVWHCAATKLDEESLAPRSSATFPMPQHESRRQWLRESETIVNKEQSLLFCAPPNTGSLQFRMLAKRMQGVDHWSVSNDQPLLFDTVASELPLLDLTDTRLMEDIYTNNDSGWIKIGVVRDPVTRLLSAYLDLVRNWPSGATGWPSLDHDRRNRHRALRIDDDWEWFDAIRRHRVLKGDMTHQAQTETGNHGEARASGKGVKGVGTRGESGNAVRGLLDVAVPTAPTFEELLDLLAANIWAAPSAFRPAASLCGMWKSPFDTIIPFETLQQTSTKVLKSLPGNIWRSFGKSGWGPDGKHAFMEFDYGTAARHDVYTDEGDTGRRLSKETAEAERETWHRREAEAPGSAPPAAPPRARDMFSGDSCAWIEYYADENILKKVGHLYKADFDLFEWYKLDAWRDKLEVCLQGRT
ncbi:unnamed protein product, partial [Laminaria digitata]